MRRRRTARRRRFAFGDTCTKARGPKSLNSPSSDLLVSAHACGRLMAGSAAPAIALFGLRRIEQDAWRTASLRDTTIRLVRDGVRLMRGGYLDLLRRAGRSR